MLIMHCTLRFIVFRSDHHMIQLAFYKARWLESRDLVLSSPSFIVQLSCGEALLAIYSQRKCGV